MGWWTFGKTASPLPTASPRVRRPPPNITANPVSYPMIPTTPLWCTIPDDPMTSSTTLSSPHHRRHHEANPAMRACPQLAKRLLCSGVLVTPTPRVIQVDGEDKLSLARNPQVADLAAFPSPHPIPSPENQAPFNPPSARPSGHAKVSTPIVPTPPPQSSLISFGAESKLSTRSPLPVLAILHLPTSKPRPAPGEYPSYSPSLISS